MEADGIVISLPVDFLFQALKFGFNDIRWTCLFNTHSCDVETRVQKTNSRQTLRLSVSQSGKRVDFSNALEINITDVHIEENHFADQVDKHQGCHVNTEMLKHPGTPISPDTPNQILKRKRGRPRKSASDGGKQNIVPQEIEGKRYSLRGVKISESIMNAEKGIESNGNDKDYIVILPIGRSEDTVDTLDQAAIDTEDLKTLKIFESEDLRLTIKENVSNESEDLHNINPNESLVREFSDELSSEPAKSVDSGKITNKLTQDSNGKPQSDVDGQNDFSKSKSYTCHQCEKSYKKFQTLRNHIRYVHKITGQKNHCKLCPAKFKHSSVLKQHCDEIHNMKINFTCAVCKKEFARRNQYNRHMLSHGGDKSRLLNCPHCEKGFWFKYNLARHIELVHKPSVENFHCSYCGKGFSLKAAMVSHVQHVHFNIFPFQCSVEGCKMGFSRQRLLLEHMQQSHSEVTYKPPQLSRGRYKYGRTDEDLFFCSHCRVSFCYKAKLVEHMHFDHNDSFPYICDQCSQGFVEKSFLLHHLKYAHHQAIENKEIEEAKETVEELEELEELTEDRDVNCKIIMVDEEGEVLQICQPIAKDTTATLEMPGTLTNAEETVTLSYSMTSDNQQETVQYIIQPDSDQTAVIPQEIADILLSGGQTIITHQANKGSETSDITSDITDVNEHDDITDSADSTDFVVASDPME